MAGTDDFMASIDAFVEKAKSNQEQVVRAGCIRILARLVEMSPVGNPELWKLTRRRCSTTTPLSSTKISCVITLTT